MVTQKHSILVVHEGRRLIPAVEKALVSDEFSLVTIPTRNADLASKAGGVGCAVVVLEGDDSSGCSKIMERIKLADDNLPIIVVARSKSVEDAVSIMRSGAYDYITYPLDAVKLRQGVMNAVQMYDLTKRVFLLETQMGWRGGFDNIIGHCSAMQEMFGMISMVAKSNATVLVSGESGTGKELVAKAIHKHSERSSRTMLDINCGAIPRELLENELFGHERGAYTGADKRYIGSCERADGGTLFLDEISEMDPLLQVKLLRFLQERCFVRIGGRDQIRVDVRIVAATNRKIEEEVKAGRFREDLYYRLNVVPIHIPALRERREDIPALAKHFLEKYSEKNEKIFLDFAPQAIEALVAYDWPGNVRELENAVERMVVLNNDTRVKSAHLPENIRLNYEKPQPQVMMEPSMAPLDGQKVIPLELVEKYAIESALKRCLGNVSEAARKLKIGQATLYRKIKQYGLR
jgi:DNA-binding NtrC family response regulator